MEKPNGRISIYDNRTKPAKTKSISINIPKGMTVQDIQKSVEKCLFGKC